MREGTEAALMRWQKLEALQKAYSTFVPFLEDMMLELGFKTSDIQRDIAGFLQYGPHYLMIMAQRGQAKTTITAIFAVWCLIHNPRLRVLIISAGETQANEISTLVVKLITTVDILECLKPDRSNGDRTSVEAFDVHYSLKGIDKSPSVACVGVTGNLQGKRADLLIADDVESLKNSKTATMREQLELITKDFVSICTSGRIIYLGTPQSSASIYNALPSRGFAVRIWPGRLPTVEQQAIYGDLLAPYIRAMCEARPTELIGFGLDNKQGAATDPVIVDEEALLRKETDQGASWFQLQYMLMTALSDSQRYPLKLRNLIVMAMNDTHFPLEIVRGFGREAELKYSINGQAYTLMAPHSVSKEVAPLQGKVMYIDPAGGGANADETAYAVVGLLNSTVFLLDVGGVPGGYEKEKLERLAALVVKHRPSVLKIEKNFGFGSFREVLQPVVRKACETANVPCPGIEDDMVTGQKELRIINTLEPVMGRGSLVINEAILQREAESISHYDLGKRNTYSLFFQLAMLTRDKGALHHDDRADAVEGGVRHFVATLVKDQTKAIAALRKAEVDSFMRNPLGRRGHTGLPKPNSAVQRMRRL